MCATVSIGRASVDVMPIPLSLLQSSHPGLARAPMMCSHFQHGNEHVITCLARLFFASCTALESIHELRHSLLSPSLSKNSAAQVVAASLFQFFSSLSWSMHLHPQRSLSIRSPWAPVLAACPMLCSPMLVEFRKVLLQLATARFIAFCL